MTTATEVLTKYHIPLRVPLPLRTKVSYAKGVTVCIAAACGGEKPCIVLCSDTRLDLGDLGSTNTTAKFDVLGHSWCVQMAGDWSNVCQWKDRLKREIQSEAANLDRVAECIKNSAEYFAKSIFCEPGKSYQLLLSGFPNGKRTILSANLYPLKKGHSLTVAPSDSFAGIGSGYAVASAMLSARECHGMMPLEYILYLVYEAKRISEKTGSVGARTVMALHLPGHEETIDRAGVVLISKSGLKRLEGYHRESWKVPFRTFPRLDSDFYFVPEDLQGLAHPKADPKSPQPSPESPAKSDES